MGNYTCDKAPNNHVVNQIPSASMERNVVVTYVNGISLEVVKCEQCAL